MVRMHEPVEDWLEEFERKILRAVQRRLDAAGLPLRAVSDNPSRTGHRVWLVFQVKEEGAEKRGVTNL